MKIRIATLTTIATLVLLGACSKQEQVREIDWAKAALSRNPAFEIVATDETSGVFTVRDTSTGTMRTLKLEELIAAPLPPKVAQPAAAPAPAEPVESPTIPEESATLASSQTTTPPVDGVVEAARAAPGQALAEGPGYSIARAHAEPPKAAGSTAQTLEGPGYSITREQPSTQQSEPSAEQIAANVERRTDPIVCQGDRLMRIDGETIEFTGDAVIAERGCDLYISNARIRAGGVGIIARQARVHIVNSTIDGTRGSYEASEGAEIYVARSTFTGIGRRFDSATMNDLGDNIYEMH